MPEPHPGTDLDQPRALGRSERVDPETEPFDRAQQKGGIAERFGRRREQQLLR